MIQSVGARWGRGAIELRNAVIRTATVAAGGALLPGGELIKGEGSEVMRHSKLALGLLASVGGLALAASAAAAAPPTTADEVVVTASRQGETAISKIPMSVVATTQKSLDDLNIKSSQDLTRLVPALRIAGGANSATGPNISIRGIQSTTQGAPTTGVYLDDSPLQARTLSGLVNGGGAFLPILFDLERVEVLKGPQGTLYGSSSEGGTLRYITPDPRLTGDYSMLAKGELTSLNHGDYGGEAGVALGGPLVEDKLGFRGSVFYRKIGGWIDHVDWRDGGVVAKDTNWEDQKSARLAVLWKPTDRLSIKPSFYYAEDQKNDADTKYDSTPAYTAPALATVLTGAGANGPVLRGGATTPIVERGLLPTGYTPSGAIACPVTGVMQCYTNVPGYVGQTVFVHPGHTYGPLNLGPYDTLVNTNTGLGYAGPIQPKTANRTSKIAMASLDAKYDAGPVILQSITSWVHDTGDGYGDLTLQETQNTTVTVGGGYDPFAQSPFVYDLPGAYESSYFFHGKRTAWTEEARVSSNFSGRISFTGGAYFQSATTQSHSEATQDRNLLQLTLLGHKQLGIAPSHSAGEVASNLQTANNQTVKEERYAFFGEGNLQITRQLRFTAGLRWSHEQLDFKSYSYGLLFPGTFTDQAARTLTGKAVETPITPKFSLSYQATDNVLVYTTAAKGFRPGGVQGQASAQCATDLAALGLTSTPATFGADSVWSYEAGAKVRAFDRRVSLSGSAFDVEWNKPQTPYLLPTCVFSYLTNIGKARSTGFDLQGDVKVTNQLRANFNVGYTNARYTETVQTVPNAAGVRTTLVFAGQPFVGIPKWQFNFGGRYDAEIGRPPVYLTVNWQHIGEYPNATPPGTSGYAPDAFTVPAMNYVTARLGLLHGDMDLSIFADNLFNENKLFPNTLTGRATCRNANCSTFASYYYVHNGATFRPRMIGITAVFRR